MNKHSSNDKPRNTFRIIAGTWRSRRLAFPGSVDTLRPTTDRVRETLFNWLQQKIVGANCLDLFAGSGALAFEALSRGAASVTAVDASTQVTNTLRDNARLLDCHRLHVVNADAMDWMRRQSGTETFDIVFLDPPYDRLMLQECMLQIEAGGLLAPGSIIYVEAAQPLEVLQPPANWTPRKSKKAGRVHYGVFEKNLD